MIHACPGGTKQLYCENLDCPARRVRKFVHFCSKTRMEIEGLAEQTLETFVDHGWVKNFGDLYKLERHKADIIACPGFGAKSFARLQQAIDRRRTCTLNQFIAALGIPEVGRHAGRILNRHFSGDWDASSKPSGTAMTSPGWRTLGRSCTITSMPGTTMPRSPNCGVRCWSTSHF